MKFFVPHPDPEPELPEGSPKAVRSRQIRGALGFVAFLILLFGVFGAPMDLKCERVEPGGSVNCFKRTRLFWFIPMPSQRIENVRGAQVSESSGYEGSAVYRVELITSDGVIPLSSGYTSGSMVKEEFASQVNAFVSKVASGNLAITEPGLLSFENIACFLIWIPFGMALEFLWGTIRSVFKKDQGN